MNRNKKIIYIMVVLLAVIAGWLYFENSSGKEVRAMGFPSIRAVPDGFNYAEAKSIDTGDWCEVTYENGRGGFVSLDCYVPGSFDTMFLDNYAGSKDKTTVGNKETVVYRNLAENDSSLTILTWNDMAQNAQCVLGGMFRWTRWCGRRRVSDMTREKPLPKRRAVRSLVFLSRTVRSTRHI